MCVNLKKQPLHPLQLLVDLPGKWRIRECQRETETENQRESNRDSFKAFCGCVIESWSSCACLTHWVMVGCLGSHTHTFAHTECRADIPEVPHPLHSTSLSSSSLSFYSTSSSLTFWNFTSSQSFFFIRPSAFTSHPPPPRSDGCQSSQAQHHPTLYEPCLDMTARGEEKQVINESKW